MSLALKIYLTGLVVFLLSFIVIKNTDAEDYNSCVAAIIVIAFFSSLFAMIVAVLISIWA